MLGEPAGPDGGGRAATSIMPCTVLTRPAPLCFSTNVKSRIITQFSAVDTLNYLPEMKHSTIFAVFSICLYHVTFVVALLVDWV